MNLITQLENYIPYNEQEQVDRLLMLEYIKQFPNILTRENTLCHFTTSNWIVNKERNKILMAHHNIYNSWAWTGGHADGEADLLLVARKEAQEETGLKNLNLLSDGIFAVEILTVNSHIKRGQFISGHLHLDCCFLWEADETETLTIKEDENSGVAWIPIEDVCKVTKEEHMKPIYEKLNKKLTCDRVKKW